MNFHYFCGLVVNAVRDMERKDIYPVDTASFKKIREKGSYIMELKINGTAEDAIQQIERKHYGRPFESDLRRLYKIGIGFSKETHTIESSIII